jgi:nucleotide-binding universal stress UspA family protein
MPRIVVLPVSGSSADAAVLAQTLVVARMFEAHLVGLHVRPNVRQDIAALAASDGGSAAGIDTMLERMETDADARAKTASDAWRAFCSRNNVVDADAPGADGVTAEWACETGSEADWLAEYGRAADLIVVGRGEEDWGPDYVLMEAALMNSGKPVLIAPKQAAARLDGTVGIAWKDTRESAGAIRAALPFLRRAERVVIFTVPESENDDSPDRLARMLRWHNPNVTVQSLPDRSRPPVAVLLDAAAEAGCGLLVMGAYGHTRLREAVFGGFTRAVLESAPLPVLMAH